MTIRPFLHLPVPKRVLLGAFVVAMLLAPIVIRATCRFRYERQAATRATMVNLELAVVKFDVDHDRCPRSMAELIGGGYVTRAPLDGWHHPLILTCPSRHEWRAADVISAGLDGRFNTADDLRSWER
jgi:hypothetical protein